MPTERVTEAQLRDCFLIQYGFRPVCHVRGEVRVQQLQEAGLLRPGTTWARLAPPDLTALGRLRALEAQASAPPDAIPVGLRHEVNLALRRQQQRVLVVEAPAAEEPGARP